MAPIIVGPNEAELEVTEDVAKSLLLNKGEYRLLEAPTQAPKRRSSPKRPAAKTAAAKTPAAKTSAKGSDQAAGAGAEE